MPRKELEGSELLERMQLLGRAFRPAAPVDRRDLFAGRAEQLAEVFAAAAQPAQHAVIYGERGVGKTSLATVAAETLRSSNVLSARATCDTSDDFDSVWHKALDEVQMRTPRHGVGFASETVEAVESASQMLGTEAVTPHTVRKALHRLTRRRELVVSSTSSTGCATRRPAPSSPTRSRLCPTSSLARRSCSWAWPTTSAS